MLKSSKDSLKGIVFKVQRYSIQDGPGIRTTVFLKGCPLRCWWCANPEGQALYPEVFVRTTRCTECGKCVDVCSCNAISAGKEGVQIDRDKCDLCMKCVDVCLTGALERVGEHMTVGEIVDEVSKDKLYYRNSGGGVTLSGGEPLYQGDFAINILKECKKRSIDTALDTTLCTNWDVVDRALEYTDLVLCDIKHLDTEMHRQLTGVGNELILENLKRVINTKRAKVWIRIPLIPNYNDSEEHITRIVETLLEMPVEKVSLLVYHELGKSKYEFLGKAFPFAEVDKISEDKVESLEKIIRYYGKQQVTVGY